MPRTSIRPPPPGDSETPASSLENQAGFMLRRAYQRASVNLLERIGPYELTVPQFATLARLYECGPLSQNRLGRLVAMEPANIRDVVQRLKARGLVSLSRDGHDSRLTLVALTPDGFGLASRLVPIDMEATAKTLSPLDPHEQALLFDFLRRLAG